ncbi:polyprenyl synthetase family protein [Pseudobdellovibrio exovorus]|uniref:Octaprenyl diphosphate synthase n=1 Tax=Pseudobdellovibrio exovorus JSS TaxID=1184267 RepID=M4VAR5_9BACT|nr:polyprenyl synthetase family protein [Pseudobdellovibrio exovorus]AGH96323.1 octaprenyl diphosphate synthase [Pseudobdellovibrio exovorus JSS]
MNYKIYSPQDFPAYLPKLNSLYDDLFSGGKGFRSKLIGLVSEPLKLEVSTQTLLAQTIEFIHNASLLHDDLIDRSHLRRGKKTAWLKYTPEYAVLAGDYLLARVMVNLSSFGNIKLVQYTAEIISDLLEGEWLQDSVVGDYFVTLEQLDRIHHLKTASLFKWCLRSPFIAREDYTQDLHFVLGEMGAILGQLFQRSDDLLDYDIRNHEGKAVLGDLKSGYLNSVGAFMTRDLSRTQLDQVIKSSSLADLHLAFSSDPQKGKEIFDKKIAEFDQMNTKLIDLYNHHLSTLDSLLNGDEKKLVNNLKPLTEILYWRRKPSS